MIIVVIGVAGSGKSTVGRMLASSLSCEFLDGDDYHSPENKAKMHKGIPLNDDDRIDWLNSLNKILHESCNKNKDVVLACSALKESYRKRLSKNIAKNMKWVYLKGDFDTVYNRLSERKDHFFDPDLLRSQFETFEEPANVIAMDIRKTPIEIVDLILSKILG